MMTVRGLRESIHCQPTGWLAQGNGKDNLPMADVLTLQRLKRAILVAVTASLLFASGMMVQSATADPEVTGEDLNGFFLAALQVDFVCNHIYTKNDRTVLSVPLAGLLGGTYSAALSSSNFGYGLCSSGEMLRIQLSINPYSLNGI